MAVTGTITDDQQLLIDAWLANADSGDRAHLVARLARHVPEEGWLSILAIVARPDAQPYLAALARPLSTPIARHGAQFIDRIESAAAVSAQFRRCLACVSSDPVAPIPEALWARLSAAAGTTLGPIAPHMSQLYTEIPRLAELLHLDPHPLDGKDASAANPTELSLGARDWVVHEATFWAWEELHRIREEDGFAAAWPLVLALVRGGSDRAVAQLGAGVLEKRLVEDGLEVILRVETQAAIDPRFRYCLSHVWVFVVPEELRDRIVAARGTEPQRG